MSETLDGSLQRAQSQLAFERKRSNRATVLTGIIGALLLALLGVCSVAGYRALADFMEPNTLVGVSADYLERSLPAARAALEAEVDASAAAWAKQLSAEAVAHFPPLRESIEEQTLEETGGLLENTAVITPQQFRTILRNHRPLLEECLGELATDPKLSEESLRALQKALQEQLQADVERQSRIVLEELITLAAQLRKLAEGKDLNPEEQLQRQVLMGIRRLQLQQTDPAQRKSLVPKPPAAQR